MNLGKMEVLLLGRGNTGMGEKKGAGPKCLCQQWNFGEL